MRRGVANRFVWLALAGHDAGSQYGKYAHCGKGRDSRGNRVRAQVARRGDYCSPARRKAVAEVDVIVERREANLPAEQVGA